MLHVHSGLLQVSCTRYIFPELRGNAGICSGSHLGELTAAGSAIFLCDARPAPRTIADQKRRNVGIISGLPQDFMGKRILAGMYGGGRSGSAPGPSPVLAENRHCTV